MVLLQDGWTPLHFAAYGGSVDVARELLKLGARPRTADKVRHEARLKLVLCMAVSTHNLDACLITCIMRASYSYGLMLDMQTCI